jgi:hypothetical protein
VGLAKTINEIKKKTSTRRKKKKNIMSVIFILYFCFSLLYINIIYVHWSKYNEFFPSPTKIVMKRTKNNIKFELSIYLFLN